MKPAFKAEFKPTNQSGLILIYTFRNTYFMKQGNVF